MKYYIIRESMDLKKVGHYFQIKETKHNCDVWSEPRFIEHHELKKLDFEPITSNGILFPKSKLTDLISGGGMGFTRKLLISEIFKKIIEVHAKNNVSFFKSPLIQNKISHENYWILYSETHQTQNIDLKKSKIVCRKRKEEGGTYLEIMHFENYDDFDSYLNSNKLDGKLYFETTSYNESLTDNFITIKYSEGGIQYLVSERLKKEIEDAGCTGIEFQPSELSYNEWTAPGGEREKVYGKS